MKLKPFDPNKDIDASGQTNGGADGICFCASSLPTYPDRPENEGSYYYWGQIHSIPAIKAAIEQRLIRQDGTFDKNGRPCLYG